MFIAEAGGCTEIACSRERRALSTEILSVTGWALNAEMGLLLPKAPCCQRLAGSSLRAGGPACKDCAPGVLAKSCVYFSGLRWPLTGSYWRDSSQGSDVNSGCQFRCLHGELEGWSALEQHPGSIATVNISSAPSSLAPGVAKFAHLSDACPV